MRSQENETGSIAIPSPRITYFSRRRNRPTKTLLQARLILAAVLLVLFNSIAGCVTDASEVGPLVGQKAPLFTVTSTGGDNWTLASQQGKVVLLDLMGVNCPPCREAMPHLRAVALNHAADHNFTMISLDMAAVFPGLGARDTRELVEFQEEHDAEWPFAPDANGTIGGAYEPIALPTLVIIDPDGVIRAKITSGVVPPDRIEKEISAARGP